MQQAYLLLVLFALFILSDRSISLSTTIRKVKDPAELC